MLFPRESETREVKELGGVWEFAKDPDDVGVKKEWFAVPPRTRPMAVRANYNEQTADEELLEYFGAVWYFRKFIVPATWRARRIVLRIGAANYSSRVWLDGRPLMTNKGGALPFEKEITRRARPGEEHLLAVRIDSTLSQTTIPATLPWKSEGRPFEYYFDFLNMSGIHRPVRLYATSKTYLKDVTVTPSIRGKTGRLAVSWETAGKADRVRLTLIDAKGRAVASKESAGGEAALSVPNARLWSPASPYLYTLKVEVMRGGEVVDHYPLPVGIRTVKVSGDRFLLNGRPVYFKGASRHEDFPVIGRGVSEAVLVKDFSLMEWVNANSFRTVHYPYAEEVLNMADRMGFLVIDETACVGMNDWVHKVFTKGVVDEKTRKTHLEQLERQYQRDKNHACVVMWSLANEPASGERGFVDYIKPLFKRMRELDSTRPVTFVSTTPAAQEKAAGLCDVICVNRYYGWYQRTAQLGAIEDELSAELDLWHKRFGKPMIISEFGADTIEGFHHQPPVIFSEEYQVELLKHYTNVFDRKPYVIGEHVWVMFDFATKQEIRRVGGNRKGIFTRSRQPKMAAHFFKSRWAAK